MPLVLPGHEVSLNEPGRVFDRHHHLSAYAALLVDGACDEAGDRGRFSLRPGDVICHEPFEAHRDWIGSIGAKFLNFVLPPRSAAAFGHVRDLDGIVLAYRRDPREAAARLLAEVEPYPHAEGDWPDLLAASLAHGPTRLDEWADRHGLNPSSLSRGFKLAYGVTPKRYRLEQMASSAGRRIRATAAPLSMIAAETGFADQAHMTRALTGLFGVTPRRLRSLS
jgi:AraC-like DNA-binding protein